MSVSTLTGTGRFPKTTEEEGTSSAVGGGGRNGGQEFYYYGHESSLYMSSGGISEIEEEGLSDVPTEVKELFGIRDQFVPMPSIREEHDNINGTTATAFDVVSNGEDSVCVAVGKSESSMVALTWTLKHAVRSSSSTTVNLIHIFPEIRLVPSPCKFSLSLSLISR